MAVGKTRTSARRKGFVVAGPSSGMDSGGDGASADGATTDAASSEATRSDGPQGRPCPFCGASMVHRHCKYVCPEHGVVYDCSDTFY